MLECIVLPKLVNSLVNIAISDSSNDVLDSTLQPLIFLTDSIEAASALAAHLREQKTKGILHFDTVRTIDNYFPMHQEEKVKLLKKIKGIFTPKVIALLDKDEERGVENFLKLEVFAPFQREELPPSILSKYTEKNGTIGRVVNVDSEESHIEEICASVKALQATMPVYSQKAVCPQ